MMIEVVTNDLNGKLAAFEQVVETAQAKMTEEAQNAKDAKLRQVLMQKEKEAEEAQKKADEKARVQAETEAKEKEKEQEAEIAKRR